MNETIVLKPYVTQMKGGQMSKFVQKGANLGLPSRSPVTTGTINFLLVQVATQFRYTMLDSCFLNENQFKKT